MSAISTRGKESDSDSDDDLSYFTFSAPAAKRQRKRPLTPPRIRTPSPERARHAEGSESEGELCASERLAQSQRQRHAPVKRIKARTKGTHAPVQPKEVNIVHVGLVETAMPLKEENAITRMKRELAQGFVVPDPSEEQVQFIRQTVAEHCAALMADDGDPSEAEILAIDSSPDKSHPAPRLDESVNVEVRMVADPARKEAGHSARAIARYERKRIFKVNRRDPLSRLLGDLADDLLASSPHGLILEWKGDQILSSQSPYHLGIQASQTVDMLCYEQDVWDKVASARDAASKQPSTIHDDSKAGAEVAKVELKLRGIDGELRIRVPPFVTAARMLKQYAKAKGLPPSRRLRLEFDGEVLDDEMRVGDMGVEDDDMIEVRQIP